MNFSLKKSNLSLKKNTGSGDSQKENSLWVSFVFSSRLQLVSPSDELP